MSNTTIYSREFLRGYREQQRRQMVDHHIGQWIGDILTAAQRGDLEYSFSIDGWRTMIERSFRASRAPADVPTNEEIAEGLLRKFPGCDVTITQDWVDVRPGARELQTRITVSWK
jgi:hypothetical protein